MTRFITSSILAASIVLGSLSTSPAQASNKDVGRILAGALTLAIIAKVIADNKRSRQTVARADVSRHQNRPAPLPGPARMKRLRYSLPGECLFNIRTRNGERAVFGTLCLKETTSFVNRLPSDCQDRIRVRYGRRADVYDAKCLRERGYQVARYAR